MGLIANDTNVDQIKTILVFTERALEEAHSSAHAQQQGLRRARLGPMEGFQGLQCHLKLMLSFSWLFLVFFSALRLHFPNGQSSRFTTREERSSCP